MKFIPHDYQQYAIEYIETHEVAAVLLDMGLGKTAITLTALYALLFDYFEITRVLVIAPLRVARNTWPQEIEKWDHLKDVRYSVAVGTEKERLEAFHRDADIYIINRENVQWMVENVPFEFDAIVVDELSSFKNWNSKRFKSLMKVRPKAKRVIGLTGTPSGNGLMDLFAEFKVLDMGQRLGRFITKYRQDYSALPGPEPDGEGCADGKPQTPAERKPQIRHENLAPPPGLHRWGVCNGQRFPDPQPDWGHRLPARQSRRLKDTQELASCHLTPDRFGGLKVVEG